MTILVALTAALPELPASVQFVQEGRVQVMRNLIDDTPLYTLDKDEPAKSNCDAACAAIWRPLWATGGAKPIGKWTVVTRGDDTEQWAYEGRPVYSFARDPEPVTLGGGVVGTWRLLPTLPVP